MRRSSAAPLAALFVVAIAAFGLLLHGQQSHSPEPVQEVAAKELVLDALRKLMEAKPALNRSGVPILECYAVMTQPDRGYLVVVLGELKPEYEAAVKDVVGDIPVVFVERKVPVPSPSGGPPTPK